MVATVFAVLVVIKLDLSEIQLYIWLLFVVAITYVYECSLGLIHKYTES